MEGKFKPLGDRVLVKPTEVEEQTTKSGIIISDAITSGRKVHGTVVSVGTGIWSQNGERIPMTVQVGDTVVYEKSQATNDIQVGDEKYVLFNEHQLIGIVRQ